MPTNIIQTFPTGAGGAEFPAGGTTGQALVKKSNADQDVEWSDVDSLPSGGTKDQVLTKNSSTDGDASWKDVNALPSGGTTGQSLTKKSNSDGDVEWSDPLSLGETNTTAYAGDKGKANADHIGNLSNLSTTAKTDLVSAVNEVNDKIPQVSSLPTASNDNLGRVYQYVGADADPLFSNYFYKCTYDSSTSTYSWTNVKVQPDGSLSMEITKADYDNLSEAEKTDGTTYFVTDWTPEPVTYSIIGKFDKANIYTEDERMIGSYLGKPLYQKTIHPSLTNNSYINISSLDCEYLDVFNVMYKQKSNGRGSIPFLGSGSCSFISEYSNGSITKITTINSNSYITDSTYDAYVTLQYTKTSDPAATGEVTYSSENDYSTTETIIGTWIDGRPIYQKTLISNVTLSDEWAGDIDVTSLSISTLVSITGTSSSTNANISLNGKIVSNTLKIYANDALTGIVMSTITIQYTKTT